MIAQASLNAGDVRHDREASDANCRAVIGRELGNVRFAWLRPDGCIIPIEPYGHDRYAESIGSNGNSLLKRGWMRLMEGHWMDHRVTQAQLDAIWDWYKNRDDSFVAADWDVI